MPNKVKCALVCFEDHLETRIRANGIDVRDLVASLTRQTSLFLVKVQHQPLPLPVDTVIAIEGLASPAHKLPLKVFAGVARLCVLGVKGWADA